MRFPPFFRRKEPKKKIPPQPLAGRLINLAAILLFAGLLIAQMRHGGSAPPPAPASGPPLDGLRVHYVEAAQQQGLSLLLRLGASGGAKWNDTRPGTGTEAACGRKVALRVALIENVSDAPVRGLPVPAALDWRLGRPATPFEAVLESMVTAQRVGGVREMRVPLSSMQAAFAPGQPTERNGPRDRLVRLRLTLTRAEPARETDQPLIVLETVPGDDGHRAACGQVAALAVRLWDAEGHELPVPGAEPVVDDTPLLPSAGARRLRGTLGGGAWPEGMERAVEGMGLGATRLALIPPDLQPPAFPAETADGRAVPSLFPAPARIALAQITLQELEDAPLLRKPGALIEPAEGSAAVPPAEPAPSPATTEPAAP